MAGFWTVSCPHPFCFAQPVGLLPSTLAQEGLQRRAFISVFNSVGVGVRWEGWPRIHPGLRQSPSLCYKAVGWPCLLSLLRVLGYPFLLSQEFVFVLAAGSTLRAEIGAEKAGKVNENHQVQHEQNDQQKRSQVPLTSILQEELGEVDLRGQAEEKVHDQVDILVDPVEEMVLGVVYLHHHP